MTTIEQKITKLLRLAAGNANIHEASAAFAQAQALADRHAIDLETMRVERAEKRDAATAERVERAEITRVEIHAPGRTRSAWRGSLASAVARANGCRVYTAQSHKRATMGLTAIWVYGPADRLELVRTLYHWIHAQVERLGAVYARGKGRSAGRDFRLGAVHEVSQRLRAEREKTLTAARADAYARGGETALARVSTALATLDRSAEVERYGRVSLGLRRGSALAGARGGSAYAAGRAAGRSVSTGPRGQIGGGS